MIPLKPIKNPMRKNDFCYLDNLAFIGNRIKTHFDYIHDFQVNRVIDVNAKITSTKKTFVENYVMKFKIKGIQKVFEYTFDIKVPTVLSNFLLINSTVRIPLIQLVDSHVSIINSNKVRLFNNIHEIIISKQKNEFTFKLIGGATYPLLPIMCIIHDGLENFIKSEFPNVNITIKENIIRVGDNIAEKCLFIPDNEVLSHEDLLKLKIFNYTLAKYRPSKDFNINLKSHWSSIVNINGNAVTDLFFTSTIIDVFSKGTIDDINLAFRYLSNPDYDLNDEVKNHIKNNKNNINLKRFRDMEILLIPLLRDLYNMCIRRRNLRADRIYHIDLCKKTTNRDFVSMYQQFNETYSILMLMYNMNKVTSLGIHNINKTQIGIDRRVIHESYKNTLCPIVTPDRGNCGLINELSMNALITDDYVLSELLTVEEDSE